MAALKKQQAELQGKVSEAEKAREAAEVRAKAAEEAASAAAAHKDHSAEEGGAAVATLEAAGRAKDEQLREAEERVVQAQGTAISLFPHSFSQWREHGMTGSVGWSQAMESIRSRRLSRHVWQKRG